VSLGQRLLMAGQGGAFTPPAPYTITDLTSPAQGGGVWFGAARAVRNGDDTIAGYQTGDSGGDVKAILIDNDTGAVTSTTTLYNNFIVDDHSPPSFVVRPDGIIMAAFAYHLGELYVGIGTSPGVLPAQAQVTNITAQVGTVDPGVYGYTYASIWYLDDEDRYYIFCRYHDSSLNPHVVFTYSDDDGATWAAHTVVQDITYHQVVKNGTDRFDLVTSDHPDHGQGDDGVTHTSIYHLYYDGTWHKSDGTGLTLPVANTGATLVYDGTPARAWLWGIAIDAGNPVIVFVVYEEPYATGPWHYGYAVWTGSWVVNDDIADAGGTIVTAGAEHYAGGICLDYEDPRVVWYSSNRTGAFQVYRAVTYDQGATWAETPQTADADKNVRPVSVLGHDGRVQTLWWYGTYADYFTYSQGTKIAGQ
jgi:hypothetical protein